MLLSLHSVSSYLSLRSTVCTLREQIATPGKCVQSKKQIAVRVAEAAAEPKTVGEFGELSNLPPGSSTPRLTTASAPHVQPAMVQYPCLVWLRKKFIQHLPTAMYCTLFATPLGGNADVAGVLPPR